MWVLPWMHTHSTTQREAIHLYRTREAKAGTVMNSTRQYRERRPVRPLDGRQATQHTRSTREDWQDSTTTVYKDGAGHVTEIDDIEEQDFYDDARPGRLPSSARRYAPMPGQKIRYEYRPEVVHTTVPPRRSAQTPTGNEAGTRYTEDVPQAKAERQKRGFHCLWYVGIGMIAMLALWMGLQWLGSWWQLHQDDSTYGRPRTAQYDLVVGHNDSPQSPTHIIAMNLNSTVVVIELPGGDISKAKIYKGPQIFGPGSDLYPVTLSFPDPNGDGKPNMLVHVQGDTFTYLNQNGQFVPQPSN